MKKEEIINYFKSKKPNRYDGNKTQWKYLLKNDINMYNLLKTYFNNISEETTIRDILFCIEKGYSKIPECAICGKPLHITSNGHTPEMHFPLFCSKECRNSKEGKALAQQHYKDACEKLYGNGITNSLLNSKVQEKRRKTCMKLYGVEHPLQNKDILHQTFTTQNNGIDIGIHHGNAYMEKVYQTKKDRHTLNTSNIEKQLYEYLRNIYNDDLEYQYKSKLYPYICDFYIKSLDLYIELQANWMHGSHPFNKNNINDLNIIKKWEEKSNEINFKGKKKYGYNIAIETWTIRDVNKRNTAKQNNLNYLEIFSNNINECINIINKYIKIKYN